MYNHFTVKVGIALLIEYSLLRKNGFNSESRIIQEDLKRHLRAWNRIL